MSRSAAAAAAAAAAVAAGATGSAAAQIVDVGAPSPEFKEVASQGEGWISLSVRYHRFGDLSATIGEHVLSPEFKCFGHQWRLKVYPGGETSSPNGMVAVFIENESDKSIKIDFGFDVRDPSGKISLRKYSPRPDCFGPKGSSTHGWGFANFGNRSTIMDSLVAGALIIEVRMKAAEPLEMSTDAFVPKNPFVNAMLKSFNDEESADVAFEVGEQQRKNNSRKKAKWWPAPVTFYAHKFILKKCAVQLAELCDGSGGKYDPVPITDVKPDIFRCLLKYVYGGEPADFDLKTNAKDIIEAADKYGIGNLKLEAEAYLVQSTTITVENMMEHLLYADAKNCALLKEAVMDYIVENKVEVLEKVTLKDIPGGPTMFADILAAMARGEKKDGNEKGGENHLSTMRITDLRVKLHGKGLGVDGSRETLIAALKQNS